MQTLEGELEVEIPQVREAAEPFVSKLFPCSTKVLRTEPLRAMVIGAFVRGLSMRDIESLCEKAGLGKQSKTTALNRPGDLGGSDPWKDAESCLHSGSIPMSCANAR